MGSFDLRWDWQDPPQDDAFGPERATWAALTIDLGGTSLTSHRLGEGLPTHAVVGPLSGLADWLVENWLFLSWEIHTPFPKAMGERSVRVPSLRDARDGSMPDVPIAPLARWLHRHTFGHANSDLALPSIDFLPEDRVVGVAVSAPAYHLKPSVQFTAQWPREPVWVPRDELLGTFRDLIHGCIERARASLDTQHWAEWLETRFSEAERAAASPEVRRRLMFGEVAAAKWDQLVSRFAEDAEAFVGVMMDAAIVESDAQLELIAGMVQRAVAAGKTGPAGWHPLKAEGGEHLLPPYEQGYRLARRVRGSLEAQSKPLLDLRGTLSRLGVAVEPVAGYRLFRSAGVSTSAGNAMVFYVTDHPLFSGLAPTRFAIAAGLGRLLAEAATTTASFGAATGPQSRVRATQQANAFAAEFLLPLEALREAGDDLTTICEDYGISRKAAERHRENRLRRP
jgi:hypothetical protein